MLGGLALLHQRVIDDSHVFRLTELTHAIAVSELIGVVVLDCVSCDRKSFWARGVQLHATYWIDESLQSVGKAEIIGQRMAEFGRRPAMLLSSKDFRRDSSL